VAHTAILPLQDVLALGSDARMNTPGLGKHNWRWRVRAEAFNPGVAARLRGLVELYGRRH
jgi:4-alpha-glucanotransferase